MTSLFNPKLRIEYLEEKINNSKFYQKNKRKKYRAEIAELRKKI